MNRSKLSVKAILLASGIGLAAASLIAGALMYVRFRRRIAYWV